MVIYPGKILRPGMTGFTVKVLQQSMNEEKELIKDEGCFENGVYDERTAEMVRKYRYFFGLPDGDTTGYFLWSRLVNKC